MDMGSQNNLETGIKVSSQLITVTKFYHRLLWKNLGPPRWCERMDHYHYKHIWNWKQFWKISDLLILGLLS